LRFTTSITILAVFDGEAGNVAAPVVGLRTYFGSAAQR